MSLPMREGIMAKSVIIRVRVEPEIKAAAEAVLSRLGLSVNVAVKIFLHQIVLRNDLPFEIKNAE